MYNRLFKFISLLKIQIQIQNIIQLIRFMLDYLIILFNKKMRWKG